MIEIPSRLSSRPTAEINVVPYIDVMLVLLVIFMITTPVLEQGVEVDLPVTNSQVLDFSENEPLVITVNKKGIYSIDDRKKLHLTRVLAAVIAAKGENSNIQIMVRGDKNVAYGKIIALMTYLQHAGIEKVGFITESIPN